MTFSKEERVVKIGDPPIVPGPGDYEIGQRVKSPGGIIPQSKRMFLINEKQAFFEPGPQNYQPKYSFISKSKNIKK